MIVKFSIIFDGNNVYFAPDVTPLPEFVAYVDSLETKKMKNSVKSKAGRMFKVYIANFPTRKKSITEKMPEMITEWDNLRGHIERNLWKSIP